MNIFNWFKLFINNTFVDSDNGYAGTGIDISSDVHIYNNLAANNSTADFSSDLGPTDFEYNISSDGTADDFGGSGNIADQALKFFDENNNDFHLAPNSPGIDIGTSSVSSTVVNDIDGKPIHTYDIGADDASVYFDSSVMETGGDFSTLSSLVSESLLRRICSSQSRT